MAAIDASLSQHDSRSTPGRRRNGKEASCEPCRKMKMRCDHSRPVCGRCRRRSTQSQCYYHPAPLTRKDLCRCLQNTDTSISNLTPKQKALSPSCADPADHAFHAEANHHSPGHEDASSHFHDRNISALLADPPPLIPTEGAARPYSLHLRRSISRAERITSIAGILRHLLDLERLRNLISAYYDQSQVVHTPLPLILAAISSLKEPMEKFGLHNCASESEQVERLHSFAEAVYQSTSSRITITSDTTPSEFMDMYTGSNLRLEFVGLIMSTASRYCLLALHGTTEECDDYMHDLFEGSSLCLHLSRETTRMNDMLVWLSHDNSIVLSCIRGDSSEDTWRSLGDLCSDLLTFGINSERSMAKDVPFFLAELRRRTFARVYHSDKFLSLLFNRPPRLLKSHSDTAWPLELTHTELLADPAELPSVLEKLGPDGWSIEKKYCAATWVRVKRSAAEIAEQAAEYRWRPLTEENIIALKTLSVRNREMRRALPEHLQYRQDFWHSDMHPQICFMLCQTALSFLRNDTEILELLEGRDPAAPTELLNVAADLTSLIIELGSFRRKSVCLHHRFAYVIIYYGIPAIVVLAKAAGRLGRNDIHPLPPGLSRSRLVKLLSVFASQLDNVADPGEMNYEICTRVSEALSKTLDDLLDGANHPVERVSSLLSPPSSGDGLGVTLADIDAPNSYDWEGLDLLNWTANLDWTTVCDDWVE